MKFEFSAGGVVFKKDDTGNVFILIAQHSQHHGWIFPKGLIGDKMQGESKEMTAVREVKEETGIDAEIIEALTPVVYWYVFEGQRIKKTVYYYVMKSLGGDIMQHDFEMENVEWITLDRTEERLTYASDKKVWKEARQYIMSMTG